MTPKYTAVLELRERQREKELEEHDKDSKILIFFTKTEDSSLLWLAHHPHNLSFQKDILVALSDSNNKTTQTNKTEEI